MNLEEKNKIKEMFQEHADIICEVRFWDSDDRFSLFFIVLERNTNYKFRSIESENQWEKYKRITLEILSDLCNHFNWHSCERVNTSEFGSKGYELISVVRKETI